MTKRELVLFYKRKIRNLILELKLYIIELESMEARLHELSQKEHDWDSEIDKRFNALLSKKDQKRGDSQLYYSERSFRQFINSFGWIIAILLLVLFAVLVWHKFWNH